MFYYCVIVDIFQQQQTFFEMCFLINLSLHIDPVLALFSQISNCAFLCKALSCTLLNGRSTAQYYSNSKLKARNRTWRNLTRVLRESLPEKKTRHSLKIPQNKRLDQEARMQKSDEIELMPMGESRNEDGIIPLAGNFSCFFSVH